MKREDTHWLIEWLHSLKSLVQVDTASQLWQRFLSSFVVAPSLKVRWWSIREQLRLQWSMPIFSLSEIDVLRWTIHKIQTAGVLPDYFCCFGQFPTGSSFFAWTQEFTASLPSQDHKVVFRSLVGWRQPWTFVRCGLFPPAPTHWNIARSGLSRHWRENDVVRRNDSISFRKP